MKRVAFCCCCCTPAQAEFRGAPDLADEILVTYAAPGGSTEELCRDLLAGGKPLWTLPDNENQNLLSLGIAALPPERLPCTWKW